MNKIFLFTYLYICSIFHCFAHNIIYNEIPNLHQLPVNAIHRIFQDSEGYMWYGTVDGLCRDDGYNVEVFRSDINTPHLLNNNTVQCIAEDKEGKIWFGTNKGAYILDKKDYHICSLDSLRLIDSYIYGIYATSDGSMWVSISGHLLKYNTEGILCHSFDLVKNNSPYNVNSLCESRDGEIYLTLNSKEVCRLYPEENLMESIANERLNDMLPTGIFQDMKHDYFWMLTWNNGIVRFNPKASKDSMFVSFPLPKKSFEGTEKIMLYHAQDSTLGYIWATSLRSLHAFRITEQDSLEEVDISYLNPSEHQMLNEIINDNHGNLWVSAFDRPSFILDFNNGTIKNYTLPAIQQRINGKPAIMSLCDAGDGMMWMSQERTGIVLYDLNNDRMSCYTDFASTSKLPLESVKIMSDSSLDGSVWIVPVSSSQVYRLSHKGLNMKVVDKIDLSRWKASVGSVRRIKEDSQNQLWLGTENGLYCYHPKTNTFRIISDTIGFVTDIFEASNDKIWVCTSNKGIYQVDMEGDYINYPFVYLFSSMSMTTDGVLWLGSDEGGLYAFDPRSEKFSDYSRIIGLNGDQINKLIVDEYNHLWIDTNQRIIEFNPRNLSFRSHLTVDNGKMLWRLIPTSLCRGKDGRIYFGGIPGVCSFMPSNQLDSEAKPVKTHITNVKVMNKSIVFNHLEDVNSLSSIVLNPKDRNIEIEFSSLNYQHAHKIRYAYRMEGVDDEWMYTSDGNNSAFYSNLDKGTYRFLVKSTDDNGLWGDEITELYIKRLPAFYETWWAYTFYVVLMILVISGALYVYFKFVERKNNEMWTDSEEMMKMRDYLDCKVNLPEPEYIQMDKILLDKAMKTIEDNLMEPNFDVSALSDAMNMSRSTLTRKLKAITGRTPLELIRHIKMQHAQNMLKDKDRSVTEVAANLGYFNRKYFTACFKEEFGITPSEYQKQQEGCE